MKYLFPPPGRRLNAVGMLLLALGTAVVLCAIAWPVLDALSEGLHGFVAQRKELLPLVEALFAVAGFWILVAWFSNIAFHTVANSLRSLFYDKH